MMNKLVVVACCTSLLAPLAAGAEVYKWKDASGKMQYSDMPPMSNIPYTTLSGKKPANLRDSSQQKTDAAVQPATARPSGDAPAKTGELKREDGKPATDAKGADAAAEKKSLEEIRRLEAEIKKQEEEKIAANKITKEQNCRNARTRVANFQQGGRMYRVDEHGERHYYGDAEIASSLEQAKADVEANCE